jgi:hypothetical protein
MNEVNQMEIKININTGDIIKFNNHAWKAESIEKHSLSPIEIWLSPLTGAGQRLCLTEEELSKRLDFSGSVHLIREDYQNVIDY